jgi:large exoprotein involved in heme utilization and adhesion
MTRRELVARAAAAGGAGAAAVAGGAAGAAAITDSAVANVVVHTAGQTDGDVLSLALSLELVVVLAYRRVLDSGLLTAHAAHVVAPLLAQEHEHVKFLQATLRRLGKASPPPPTSIAYAQSQLTARNGWGSFTSLHSEKDCLGLLSGAESVAQGAYYEALGTLSHPALLRAAGQMLAAEAQHETVIEDLLHPGDVKKAVPWAFVEGIS